MSRRTSRPSTHLDDPQHIQTVYSSHTTSNQDCHRREFAKERATGFSGSTLPVVLLRTFVSESTRKEGDFLSEHIKKIFSSVKLQNLALKFPRPKPNPRPSDFKICLRRHACLRVPLYLCLRVYFHDAPFVPLQSSLCLPASLESATIVFSVSPCFIRNKRQNLIVGELESNN